VTVNRVVIAGLPSTGKTTYLALMYHALVEGRADGMCLGRYDDDREYITEISDALLGGQIADQTLMDDEREVTLSLMCDGQDFLLTIPDLSGETWEHALVHRRWSLSLDAGVVGATGFIVFVHSEDVNIGTTIVEVGQAAAALLDDDDIGGESDTDAAVVDAAADTHAEEVGGGENGGDDDEEAHCKQLTQVSLVELIQFFASRSPRPIRVSVVISAWDLQPEPLSPQKWMTKNASLLAQYLAVNDDEVEGKVFGVSAQGGSFADQKVRDELLNEDPITRAHAHAADGTTAGIAAPLRWVLRLDH
jgi:hypothetical protein